MVDKSFTTAVRRTRVRAWLIAFAIMTMFSAVTLVLWLGARSVLHGTMSGGDLAKFLSYAIFMGTSVAALSEMWGELQRASGAWQAVQGSHRAGCSPMNQTVTRRASLIDWLAHWGVEATVSAQAARTGGFDTCTRAGAREAILSSF